MHTITAFPAGIVSLLLAAPLASLAQVPGEDPVVLLRRPTIQGLPLGSQPKSQAPKLNIDMPAWQRAKVARYQARAFNIESGVVQTGQDVINAASDDGFKTTCTQSVGSTAVPSGGTAVKSGDQIVVLRGDLVNICN